MSKLAAAPRSLASYTVRRTSDQRELVDASILPCTLPTTCPDCLAPDAKSAELPRCIDCQQFLDDPLEPVRRGSHVVVIGERQPTPDAERLTIRKVIALRTQAMRDGMAKARASKAAKRAAVLATMGPARLAKLEKAKALARAMEKRRRRFAEKARKIALAAQSADVISLATPEDSPAERRA